MEIHHIFIMCWTNGKVLFNSIVITPRVCRVNGKYIRLIIGNFLEFTVLWSVKLELTGCFIDEIALGRQLHKHPPSLRYGVICAE